MSFNLDDAQIGGQLKVGTGIAPACGEGPVKVNGSAMIEGPVVIGNPTTFPWPCLLYTSPSPRDGLLSRMPSSA